MTSAEYKYHQTSKHIHSNAADSQKDHIAVYLSTIMCRTHMSLTNNKCTLAPTANIHHTSKPPEHNKTTFDENNNNIKYMGIKYRLVHKHIHYKAADSQKDHLAAHPSTNHV